MATVNYNSYNGQQVATDDQTKQNIIGAAKSQGLDPMTYDKQLNPTTYGARWGIADPNPSANLPSVNKGTGLLNPNPPDVQPAQATRAVASTYDPTKQTVSDASTVQNQIAKITASGSPLNTLAEAEADRQMNRRGLLNSSIAVGEGQKAVLQSALPIAQQDANTNAAADVNNANFANSASQFNAGAKNSASTTNAQLGTQVSLANSNQTLQQQLSRIQADTSLTIADKQLKSQQLISENQTKSQQSIADKENQTRLQLQQIDATTKQNLAVLDIDSKSKLSQLEADNRQLLQTNISAANEYAQYTQALVNIQTNKDMNGDAKQVAADSQLAALQASLKAIGAVSGLDLSKYFQSAVINPTPSVPENHNAWDTMANIG